MMIEKKTQREVTIKQIMGIALVILFAAAQLFPQQQPQLVIKGATIIDGRGGVPFAGAVIIEAGRITSVGPTGTVRIPTGARVLDATGKFLLPGLIDTHVHLEEVGLSDLGELPAAWDSPERLKELVLINARLDLIGGITTVRDLGSTELVLRVRDEINAGKAAGARIIASGMQLVKKAPDAARERIFLESTAPATREPRSISSPPWGSTSSRSA